MIARYRLRLLLFLPAMLVLAFIVPTTGQTGFSGFRQLTANEGLPSSEVYDILQDRQGFLWFSTDNGVSRYNGYSFQNFGALQGLPDPVVFYLQEDSRGRIWMQTIEGKLYFFEQDSIFAFPGNQVIDSLAIASFCEFPFYIDSLDRVFVSLSPHGLIRFSPNGDPTFLIGDHYENAVLAIENEVIPVFFYGSGLLDSTPSVGAQRFEKKQFTLVLYEPNDTFSFQFFPDQTGSFTTAFRLRDSTLLVGIYGYLFGFKNGKLLWRIPFKDRINSWFQNSKGQIFSGMVLRKGLRVYENTADIPLGKYTQLLPGYSVSHILEDRDGAYWYATTEAGVFYQPNPAVQIFDRRTGFPTDAITTIALNEEGDCYVGFDGHGVALLNTASGALQTLPPVTKRIMDMDYEPLAKRLWLAAEQLYFWQENRWHQEKGPALFNSRHDGILLAYNLHLQPERACLWVTNSFGFSQFSLTQTSGTTTSSSRSLAGPKVYSARTLDALTTSDGRNMIASIKGCFILEGERLVPLPLDHPAVRNRVEALQELPDSTLVLGSKGYGLLFWKGDQIASLTEKDGLTSNMIENLTVDADGDLWVGTLNGLNQVRWDWNAPPRLKSYTMAHGLPSNEINQVRSKGGFVWVATQKGLARFSADSIRHASPKPILSAVLSGTRTLAPGEKMTLPHSANHLTLSFFSINYKMLGQIPYRYRLDQGPWVPTWNTVVHFPDIPRGQRLFEVQSQNEDGVWSETTGFRFEILSPWWSSRWVTVSALMLLFILILSWYRYRNRRLQQAHALQKQFLELERSALQAQMNPHFIFNCLTAMQNFILQNEKEQAIAYLGNFAALVRGVLNASVSGKVSLQAEVQLLEHYLSLEQLRFNRRFSYSVEVDPGLDSYDIELPPLLIQPYVENAVLHGMIGKESGGEVRVSFVPVHGALEVCITDNGPGPGTEAGRVSTKNHKSVGMSITHRRLHLLAGETASEPVSVRPLYNAAGRPAGTEVRIRIGPVEGGDA